MNIWIGYFFDGLEILLYFWVCWRFLAVFSERSCFGSEPMGDSDKQIGDLGDLKSKDITQRFSRICLINKRVQNYKTSYKSVPKCSTTLSSIFSYRRFWQRKSAIFWLPTGSTNLRTVKTRSKKYWLFKKAIVDLMSNICRQNKGCILYLAQQIKNGKLPLNIDNN